MHQQTTTILSYSKPCITLEGSNSLHSEAEVVVVALSLNRNPWGGELCTSAALTSERAESARRSNRYQLKEQVEGELF